MCLWSVRLCDVLLPSLSNIKCCLVISYFPYKETILKSFFMASPVEKLQRKILDDLLRQKMDGTIEEDEYFAQLDAVLRMASNSACRRDIGNVLVEEAESRRKPWLSEERTLLETLQGIETDAKDPKHKERLQKAFENKARSGSLSPFEVAVCSYLLYYDDVEQGCLTLAGMLLHVPLQNRLKMHNWGLARSMNPSKKDAYGSIIRDLQQPLFPNALDELNEKLFALSGQLSGGAGPGHTESGRGLGDLYALGKPSFQGGETYEAIVNEGGEQVLALKLSGTDEKLVRIQKGVDKLISLVNGQPSYGRGTGNYQPRGRGGNQRYRAGEAEVEAFEDHAKN